MGVFALGIVFDLPALTLLLSATIWLHPKLDRALGARRSTRIVAFFVSALCLISLEENINCGQFDCQNTLWPPTMTFLLIVTCLVGAIGLLIGIKRPNRFVALACVAGLAYEMVLGGSAAAFRALDPVWLVLISALTLVSYACIFYLPLRLLLGAPLAVDLNRR